MYTAEQILLYCLTFTRVKTLKSPHDISQNLPFGQIIPPVFSLQSTCYIQPTKKEEKNYIN